MKHISEIIPDAIAGLIGMHDAAVKNQIARPESKKHANHEKKHLTNEKETAELAKI